MSAAHRRFLQRIGDGGAYAIVAVARHAQLPRDPVRGLKAYAVHVVHKGIGIAAHSLFCGIAVHAVYLEGEPYRDAQLLQEHHGGLHLFQLRVTQTKFRGAFQGNALDFGDLHGILHLLEGVHAVAVHDGLRGDGTHALDEPAAQKLDDAVQP